MQELKTPWMIDMFPALDEKLIEFLKGLSNADWERQTISPLWKVKDAAAHLLDGNIRRISIHRDNHFAPFPEIHSYEELVAHLNELNRVWVEAMTRTSPALLVELLELTGPMFCQALKSLSPDDKSIFPVAWAGESTSTHSFDVAREYTEKWLHQQQIRDAFGNTEILTDEFYKPCLETFLKAVPVAMAGSSGSEGTCVCLVVKGISEGRYFIIKSRKEWAIRKDQPAEIACTVTLTADASWKLFSKGIRKKEDARALVAINGELSLGEQILNTVAVMA